MIILSLDLSSKSTGYCVGENGKILDYGCITASSGDPIKRIIKIRNAIVEIINKYNITNIVLEQVIGKDTFARTYKVLTWLQGIMLVAFEQHENNINVDYILPNSWRAKLGIKTGRVKREQLKQADMTYVKQRFGIVANDDICDAICLYCAYYEENRSAF